MSRRRLDSDELLFLALVFLAPALAGLIGNP